jgi:signal transduction histidine kinase
LNPEQADTMTKILESTTYLSDMIDEIITQSKIEAGSINIITAPYKPAHLVEEVCDQMSVLAHRKNLSLNFELSANMPPVIIGDEEKVKQLLLNLVGNAIKFTETGEVFVYTASTGNGSFFIEVSDTGIGIPKEAWSLIFDPFRQVDSTITRSYQGTGLGLSIVKNLVEAMEGKISLASEVNKGSTFKITLPLVTQNKHGKS